MMKRLTPATLFGLLLSLLAACWNPSLHGADRVKLALPAKSMGFLPLFVAVQLGFVKDENIDLDISMMLPQIAHHALFSGEIDFHGAADSALRLAAKGAPVKAVFFGTTRPNYFLMAKPTIRSIVELKGKYIGMVRFGDTIELATRIALSRDGLELQRDTIPVMIGFPATRVAALTAGSIDATIVVPPDNVLLKQKGFRELLFLGDVVEFPSNGFATSERQLVEKRELTRRLLRALYRGLIFARERPKDTMPIIEREWKVDATVARESYGSLAKSLSRDGTSSEAGLRFHAQHIQKSEKGIGDIPATKIADFRLLEEIRRESTK
jgi:NitT/TauT family transport system substrate-binding protein